MKIGDLVMVLDEAMGSPILTGVITGTDEWGFFEVMTSNGKVRHYFAGQLRIKK